jgi:hypothetical protein
VCCVVTVCGCHGIPVQRLNAPQTLNLLAYEDNVRTTRADDDSGSGDGVEESAQVRIGRGGGVLCLIAVYGDHLCAHTHLQPSPPCA